MKVLVGECTGKIAEQLPGLGWGRMWIARDRHIYTYPGEPWGFDNGAFRDWQAGVPFDGDVFLKALERAERQPEPPYLAVIPDAPGRAAETLGMASEWLPFLPGEFPWYLAVQDGMTPADVEPFVEEIRGVFLGGTNKYKSSAEEWRAWTLDAGLRFHYARAGTQEKVRHAQVVAADSLDSAGPMWEQERWELFVRWNQRGPCQSDLFWANNKRVRQW
jgi:hypothetical protein